MNAITQHYVIDLSSNNNFVQVPAVQGDGNESRYVEIELIDHGIDYVVDPNESDVTIAGTKPDGKEIWNTCEITQEGYILVDLTYQMTAVPGRGSYQILIFSKGTNNQLKSFPFFVMVTAATYDPGYIISDDEFEALIQYTEEAKEAAEKAESAEAKAEEALEKVDEAVELVEEVVETIDTKYNEIVEMHAETLTAKDTAVAASASASTSASNAATSESNAATSESNAATSETNAAASATAAAGSASDAADSATAAATSESNADSSAEDAEAWAVGKRDGVDVGPTDETYHNNSKYYAEQAEDSATNAATSESNAATSESNAATSEANAATSESNAATSESNAATSESNAADSATLAESWAHGGTGTRTGEDSDNAEYWCHQAEAIVGIDEFVGATATKNGVRGIVPAPLRGQQEDVIMGDGTWKKLNYTFIGTTAQWTAETNKSFYQIVMLTDD